MLGVGEDCIVHLIQELIKTIINNDNDFLNFNFV